VVDELSHDATNVPGGLFVLGSLHTELGHLDIAARAQVNNNNDEARSASRGTSMSRSNPTYAQLAALEGLEFHVGMRLRRPSTLDPAVEPYVQLPPADARIKWASLDNVRDLVQHFVDSNGETSGVSVPFFLALHTLTTSMRLRVLNAASNSDDLIEPEDVKRLSEVADELDMLGRSILMKHPEMRYWTARQQPGDFGRPADFETLLEWWRGCHVTGMGFVSHLLPLVTEANVDEIMSQIPAKLEETVRGWVESLCESYSKGEKIYIAGRETNGPAELMGMPALCDWVTRHTSGAESNSSQEE
jgi:hypothetical protein